MRNLRNAAAAAAVAAVAIAIAIAVVAGASSPAVADVGLISPEQQQEIDVAKGRLDDLKEFLEDAKQLPGLDDEVKDALGNGVDMVKYAKDGLDTGVKTIGTIEKLITLHQTFECLGQATGCMTENRTPGCIQAYALGMSQLFTMLHDALDGAEFEGEGALGTLAAMRVNFMLSMYVPALEVASETFTKATKWSQICKTDEICDQICSVEENRSVFDCAELQNEFPPMPEGCETLKRIVEGEKPAPTAESIVEELQASQFFLDHSSLVKLRQDRKLVRTILVARSEEIPELVALRGRFETAVQAVDDGYSALEGLSDAPSPAALAQLEAQGCETEEILAETYARTLAAKDRIVSMMDTVHGIAGCRTHGRIRDRISRIPR